MAKKISFIKDFTIPSSTFQQRGFSRKGTYPKEGLKIAKAEWQALLELNIPKIPLGGALRLCIVFAYATKDKKKWGKMKTTSPDTSNLLKTPEDVMQKLFYFGNDSQIAIHHLFRIWDKTGWVRLELSEIDETQRSIAWKEVPMKTIW